MKFRAMQKQILKRRWSWVLFLIGGMAVFAYGHWTAAAAGTVTGVYLWFLLSDVNGELVITEKGIASARYDIAQYLVGSWEDIEVEQVQENKFRLSKPSDPEAEPVYVNVAIYEKPDKVKAILKERAKLTTDRKQEEEASAA